MPIYIVEANVTTSETLAFEVEADSPDEAQAEIEEHMYAHVPVGSKTHAEDIDVVEVKSA